MGKNHKPFSASCSLKPRTPELGSGDEFMLVHLISCCTGLWDGAVCYILRSTSIIYI